MTLRLRARPTRLDRFVRRTAVGAAALLVTVTLAGCSSGSDDSGSSASPAAATQPSASAQAASGSAPTGSFAAIPDIVDEVQPAVVTVFVVTPEGQALGSGVVWKSDGMIITNDHVAGSASKIQVGFADGTRVGAKLVATDPVTDIAVIKADRTDLPTAEFETDVPRVGSLAIAIGSPLGFQESVTAGIISGTSREVPGGGSALINLLQTDASISPGNSGGALVNGAGKVVGINDAYIPPSQGAVAIGFAIPAETAIDIAKQLAETGKAVHPYLGVAVQPLTQQIAQRLGVKASGGAVIVGVTSGGPAEKAGLQPGDVIVSLGDQKVSTLQDLYAGLRVHQPGDSVPITVVRGGEQMKVTATFGERPASGGQ